MSKQHQPIIVGLDIGTTKVVAIAGRKNEFGKLEILGYGKSESNGVQHGVVLNIQQCVKSINLAMADLMQSSPNLEINDVYVGIAGHHIKSLQTRGDRILSSSNEDDVIITHKDIELLIKDQYKTCVAAGDQIIDIIPQEYTIDNIPDVRNPVGMPGVKIGANFHVVTGNINAIKNIRRCVDGAGLSTVDLVLQPIASAAAVITDEDLEAGVAIVDIGGGTTDIAVFHDGILMHTAVIPFAGCNVTDDIKKGLGVLRNQAEAMKVQFGTVLPTEANPDAYITIPGIRGLPPKEIKVQNLAAIIEARIAEIIEFVQFQLKQNNLHQKLHGGIILTGGGSMLKHIIQLTELKTGLNARIGKPNINLAGGQSEELGNPMFATAIGLILRGYDDIESGKTFHNLKGNTLYSVPEKPTYDPRVNYAQNQSQVYNANIENSVSPVSQYQKQLQEEIDTTPVVEEKVEQPIVETKQEIQASIQHKNTLPLKDKFSKIFNNLRNSFEGFFDGGNDEKL
jgi:cell division protein FtsA